MDCQNTLILALLVRHIQIGDQQNWFSRTIGCVTLAPDRTSPNTKGVGVSLLLPLRLNLSPISRGGGDHGAAIGSKVTK